MNADALQNLGQRIVQAARLAVAMHLADALLTSDDPATRQDIPTGGAGDNGFTDEALSRALDERSLRSSFSADGGAE